jgi:hypothetical protein
VPHRGQLPVQRRAVDLHRGEAAEHQVVAHRQPAQDPGRHASRDRRADRGARAQLDRRLRGQGWVPGRQVIRERVARAAARLPHDERRRGQFQQGKGAGPVRPAVRGRHHDQQLVVAHVPHRQARGQVRGLDEAQLRLLVADEVDHDGAVGDQQLDDGRGEAAIGFGGTQLDKPVRDQVLGVGLAGGDREAVRDAGPDRDDARLEPVRGVQHLLGPAEHESPLVGEVRADRRAGQQVQPGRALQRAHPCRQRLLGGADRGRRGRHRAVPPDLAEHAQRAQVTHGLGPGRLGPGRLGPGRLGSGRIRHGHRYQARSRSRQ